MAKVAKQKRPRGRPKKSEAAVEFEIADLLPVYEAKLEKFRLEDEVAKKAAKAERWTFYKREKTPAIRAIEEIQAEEIEKAKSEKRDPENFVRISPRRLQNLISKHFPTSRKKRAKN